MTSVLNMPEAVNESTPQFNSKKSLLQKYMAFTKHPIEKKMFLIILLTFITSTLVELLLNFTFLKNSGIIANYAVWFFYLNISLAFLIGAIWHYFAYKAKINCMTGMMIGMSFGMQTGMMLGAVFGATNSFFIGATAGMLLGVAAGVWTGAHSKHTMGVLQGMMSGIMGGTMGAMISIMMLYDHLHIFMPIYMILNIVVILATSYMYYEESVEDVDEPVKKHPLDTGTVILITVILTVVMTAIILFLPKTHLII
jgi:hypothetical protein